MTEELYVVQTLLVASVLIGLCWRESIILRLQILVWGTGVIALAVRFGLTEQLNFYSNDQRFYTSVVNELSTQRFSPDIDWWLNSAKIPYTLPASILAAIGFDPTLALKTISLTCVLLLIRHVLTQLQPQPLTPTFISLFVTACGGIGMFYSLLALRETMMMLLVTRFVTTSSPANRVLMLLLIFLLRPHLAAALLVAAIVVTLWDQLQLRRMTSGLGHLGVIITCSLFGNLLFSYGSWTQGAGFEITQGRWSISTATRIASNFVGLQFLTARSETIEFSVGALLLLRILFSETIIIPALFTGVVLVRPHLATANTRLVLVAFSIYVGLVTNTDFNSFRQNIPFMTVMGLVILHHTRRSRSSKYAETSS
ncbi:MAG: hypothetical protein ACO3Z1_10230 [Ilumatobacteraceae bacterium]